MRCGMASPGEGAGLRAHLAEQLPEGETGAHIHLELGPPGDDHHVRDAVLGHVAPCGQGGWP